MDLSSSFFALIKWPGVVGEQQGRGGQMRRREGDVLRAGHLTLRKDYDDSSGKRELFLKETIKSKRQDKRSAITCTAGAFFSQTHN